MKKVSVVTINFNQDTITEELLDSIAATNTYENIEIIVVDNGSTVNPLPKWLPKYPDVTFIRSELNLGFSGGNNIGIAKATGDYYFLVNNDTEFTPGLVQKLVEVLDANPQVGIISPKLVYDFDRSIIQYMGFTLIDYYTCRNQAIGKNQKDVGQYDSFLGQTGYCHGGAMMVKRETCDKAGLMADNFFIYYEEVDWGERINRAGYQAWVRGDAVIYHKESMTVGKKSPFKEYFMNRNRILFIRHNAPPLKAFVFYIYFMLTVVPRNIISYVKEKKYNFISILFRAIWWNVTHNKHSEELGFTVNKVS
ncbi:glycosyltransferase family 2 protein [Mucilaginibacter terrenus]|uniref:Glycosyltransferase family 2 protein n=1 Tax=Mucilaginibacter terrenus TaxID=2482727 RepID=A0A3E2NVW7_9SPHI|nr:glycosyltransferase family 2 protein [Mucilaginibacter terrenus]RFZ85000.1 glycosyltransferase family 2 protein [Mucilaginibacter terrenus]